jgi:hypothetical protein
VKSSVTAGAYSDQVTAPGYVMRTQMRFCNPLARRTRQKNGYAVGVAYVEDDPIDYFDRLGLHKAANYIINGAYSYCPWLAT